MLISNKRISFSIIISMLIYAFSDCTDLIAKYEYIGEKESVSIPKSSHSTIILDFQLSVGLSSRNILYRFPNNDVINHVLSPL